MSTLASQAEIANCLPRIHAATQAGKLTENAAKNLQTWLEDPAYAEYRESIAGHVEQADWDTLNDVFWKIIPFGTGGRRGRRYPIGTNAINMRTIGESAQGLANYVTAQSGPGSELSCGIAYDTRHLSPEFARLCAEIMVAAGFKVYFLEPFRSTPELSFLVRHKQCNCGIMITASHNPPSDNAIKVYWSTGGQLVPPHDKAVIEEVMRVRDIQTADFDKALANGQIEMCCEEVDAAFQAAVIQQSLGTSRDLKIIFSPLHGVGSTAVLPVLQGVGFEQVTVFADHAEPDGDFPNVPGNVSNPENPEVFDAIIAQAQQQGADLILATDPDCDRMGCAAPLQDSAGPWSTFNGNQIGALLADYVLEQRSRIGNLTPEHYVVKTLVTTELTRRIATSYGVKTFGDLQVGFKWIGDLMERDPEHFVFGTEESHGYLTGQHARDKDAAVACLLMSELAANCKAQGQTLHQKFESLLWQHGYHAERLATQKMTGPEGMAIMQRLMEALRSKPPRELAGLGVVAARDYLTGERILLDGTREPLSAKGDNLVILDLAEAGNYVAVRPSGTEPKVKFYMFTYVAPELMADLESTGEAMHARLDQLESDLRHFAENA